MFYKILVAIFFLTTSAQANFFQGNKLLERCVRYNLSNPYVLPLTIDKLESITSLNCDSPDISTLDGIENLKNLEILNMGKQGTKLDNLTQLSSLTNLKQLYIPNSKISELTPIKDLNLTHLELNNNNIADTLPIASLTRLEYLALARQTPEPITDISFLKDLKNLFMLDLRANKIETLLPIENSHNLRYLNFNDNRIQTLEPLRLLEIEYADFSINNITNLTGLENSSNSLKVILLAYNKISSLDAISNFNNIESINFARNNIEDITPLTGKLKLARVILDINKITDITALEEAAYRDSLSELSISYNCITSIPSILKIRVRNLRMNGLCSDPPDYYGIDLLTIVNKDLVETAEEPEEYPDGYDNITQKITENAEKGSPGGCSISINSNKIDALLILVFFIILIKKVLNKKRTRQ